MVSSSHLDNLADVIAHQLDADDREQLSRRVAKRLKDKPESDVGVMHASSKVMTRIDKVHANLLNPALEPRCAVCVDSISTLKKFAPLPIRLGC
jgi:hypothetical protein